MERIKTFLCAHKPIENYIPESYIILDVTGNVGKEFQNIIDISNDEFTKTHNVCWGEGCAMRYLYNHPELISEYIHFGHYRRMFIEFAEREDDMIPIINKCGAIVKTPFNHSNSRRKNNKGDMYFDHPRVDVDVFIESVKKAAPEYWNTFQELLNDHYQYACNIFAMKKEHFLEMCKMCFDVLDHFDIKREYKNNDDVLRRMLKLGYKEHLRYGLDWQKRLQGFWLEWLTELYSRHKFGINNCYKSKATYIK